MPLWSRPPFEKKPSGTLKGVLQIQCLYLSLLEHVAKAIWIQCISFSLLALGYVKHYEVDDFDRRMEYMYEEANNCNSSQVTYSILFCWLFTFDQGSLKESVFCLHTIIVYFTCFWRRLVRHISLAEPGFRNQSWLPRFRFLNPESALNPGS